MAHFRVILPHPHARARLLHPAGKKGSTMQTRVAVMAIIVENQDSTERLNAILHDHSEYIIGRMGIPYREKGVSIISIAVDAPQDVISALSGKIGRLGGVSVKTAYSPVKTAEA